MPTPERLVRCRSCGSVPSFILSADGTCGTCKWHKAPHQEYGRFNPRCALCWADTWIALARALYICAWRAISRLRGGSLQARKIR